MSMDLLSLWEAYGPALSLRGRHVYGPVLSQNGMHVYACRSAISHNLYRIVSTFKTLPACHPANLTSLIGSIYVTSAESGDDSIYNLSRPTTKKIFFSFFQEEKLFFSSLRQKVL